MEKTAEIGAVPGRRLSLPHLLVARWYAVGVAAIATATGAFLVVNVSSWPPHEDETLALFVGRDSLSGMLHHVTHDRGGAPLHFLVAWLVAHLGGGLTALRLASAAFAVAALVASAALGARLADPRTALAGVTLAAGSWVFLFHAVFGRMYSLFLLTATLAALALLRALDRGRVRDWGLWTAAILATIASHPYGLLVFGGHGLFVLLGRRRIRSAIPAFAAVVVAGTPFWLADRRLADRFDVGVGGGGAQLGSPHAVGAFLWSAAGDLGSGWHWPLLAMLALSAVGLLSIRREGALLALCLLAVPVASFLGAHLHSSASPQTRHLIFLLPLFSLTTAAGILTVLRRAPGLAVVVVAGLLVAEVSWAWHRTPELLAGEPAARAAARHAASAWLASTSRPDDVLFGYDPLYAGAWERNGAFSRTVVPRADVVLAVRTLRTTHPLGRGVFVFDGSVPRNRNPTLEIPLAYPAPRSAFVVRRFGPFLVVRTREPTGTPRRFLELAESVEQLGRRLGMDAAVINLDVVQAARRSQERYEASGASRSSSSR